MSKRVDSHDSGNRSSHRNGSIKSPTQYRKTSNENKEIAMWNEQQLKKKTLQHKFRKDSQETYLPNVENVRISHKEWNTKYSNGVFSPNKMWSNLDKSDYNHFDMVWNKTSASGLNQTQNLKLCDYLRIIDSKSTEIDSQNKTNISSKWKRNSNQFNSDDVNKYGANITFESLSAIAKIFADDFKVNEESDIDFDDDKAPGSNIEEVTEDEVSEIIDKRKSQPELTSKEFDQMMLFEQPISKAQNNALLINAINGVMQAKLKIDNKSTWNSVIVENNKNKQKYNHSKRADINKLQRKFTVKNK